MMSPSPSIDRRTVLVAVMFMMVIVIISGLMGIYVLSDTGIKEAYTLARVGQVVERLYPDSVDIRNNLTAARDAMIDRLDRFSTYHDKRVFDRMDEELSGSYSGIGVTVVRHEQGLLIMSVRENGPANRAGILTGDIVIMADSSHLGDIPSAASTGLLRGPEGTEVKLVLYRPVTSDTLECNITREKISLMHIPYAGYSKDSVIYVRLLDFDAGAAEALREALDSLLDNDRLESCKGLILDLRGNPGGLFAEGYWVADLFLNEGTMIVGTRGRSRWDNQQFFASGQDILSGLPIAVIVDRGSASSSEIVAGALQQTGRAVLVGDTTFGKGLVQGFIRFQDGDGLRLTMSRYYVGDSLFLNRFDSTLNDTGSGLIPDYHYPFERQQPFARYLESSFLLYQFANANQDAIVQAAEDSTIQVRWVDRFANYADSIGFKYESGRTRLVRFLEELGKIENASNRVVRKMTGLVEASKAEDRNEIDAHVDYIWRRLRQIAIERKYSTYRAYNQVLVNEKPDVRYATSILLGDN